MDRFDAEDGLAAPNRELAFTHLCRECREMADVHCERCNAPLCTDHQPADDERCEACEADYRLSRRGQENEVGAVGLIAILAAIVLGVLGSIGVGVSLGSGAAAGFLIVIVTVLIPVVFGAGVFPAIAAARERQARRRFLTGPPIRARLPAADDGGPHTG